MIAASPDFAMRACVTVIQVLVEKIVQFECAQMIALVEESASIIQLANVILVGQGLIAH